MRAAQDLLDTTACAWLESHAEAAACAQIDADQHQAGHVEPAYAEIGEDQEPAF